MKTKDKKDKKIIEKNNPFFNKKVILLFLAVILFFVLCFLFFVLKDLPSPSKLSSVDISQTTKIMDRNGETLYEIYADQDRTLVKLENVPLYLRQATIAIEDKDFYKHKGVNPIGGILRATRDTLFHRKLQGGSTITQQLVKTVLLTPERTFSRKIKEIVLAFWTEIIYPKDKILEMYFNQVPYGGTAWGIEAAAKTYFGKHVKELSLSEATLLAGLPAAPTLYSPFGAHPTNAKERQRSVLTRMVEDGYISKEDMTRVIDEPIVYRQQKTDIKAPHFVMYVKEKLVEKYGEKLVEKGGLKVTTTLDLKMQEMAQDIVATEVAKLKNLRVGNGAVLITRPPTGEILTMVGSKDYFATDSGNFNVTTSHRQPGSSIKPLNYAIGLETKKVTAATMFIDTPTCFNATGQKSYCPVNYDGKFHGPVQLRFALGSSLNIPAVKMMALNGVTDFIASASAMGITTFKDPSMYGLSLTLGGGDVTMLDMSTAFGIFANTGIRKDLISILKVEDSSGITLEEYNDSNFIKNVQSIISYPSSILIPGQRILSSEVSFIISHILLDNNARSIAFGPDSYLVVPNRAVSVKTGTTDDKRDNWTIGFTPNFLTAVWVGNNDNTPMHPYLTSGVTGAAPIWNKIMREILKNQPDLWPKQPSDVIGASICNLSGKLPPDKDSGSQEKGCLGSPRYEYFIKGTIPKNTENLKQNILVDKNSQKMASPSQTDNVEMKEHQVVSDMFGSYCLDCSHEGGDPVTVVK